MEVAVLTQGSEGWIIMDKNFVSLLAGMKSVHVFWEFVRGAHIGIEIMKGAHGPYMLLEQGKSVSKLLRWT